VTPWRPPADTPPAPSRPGACAPGRTFSCSGAPRNHPRKTASPAPTSPPIAAVHQANSDQPGPDGPADLCPAGTARSVGAKDEAEQSGEAGVELLAAQPVDPPRPPVTLLDQTGAAQDREAVAERGLTNGHLETAAEFMTLNSAPVANRSGALPVMRTALQRRPPRMMVSSFLTRSGSESPEASGSLGADSAVRSAGLPRLILAALHHPALRPHLRLRSPAGPHLLATHHPARMSPPCQPDAPPQPPRPQRPAPGAVQVGDRTLRPTTGHPPPTIGRLVRNARAYVLDTGLGPVPPQRDGGAVPGRCPARPRLSQPARPDRQAVRGLPVRRAGGADVPDPGTWCGGPPRRFWSSPGGPISESRSVASGSNPVRSRRS